MKSSSRNILEAATIVARQHHERWDGKGYPDGLKGEEIHIYGRITCIADVFDALTHKRSYKKAWKIDRVIDYIKKEKGKQFDPGLVELFLAHKDEFLNVNRLYPED